MMVLNTEREAALLRLLDSIWVREILDAPNAEVLSGLHAELIARAQTRHDIHESIKRQGALT